ncbi:MAG: hypothetical protein ACREYE_16640 [Gammaproteobacteria bacterium]
MSETIAITGKSVKLFKGHYNRKSPTYANFILTVSSFACKIRS